MSEKFIISLIVDNHFGVLHRVAGLYAKRGYNIDSLAVGVTEDEDFSRITIVSTGDEYMREQVVRQLNKLQDVRAAVLLDRAGCVAAEHMLIKLRADTGNNAQISELINAFGGKLRDFGGGYVTAELTGDTERIDEFIEKAAGFGILEVCRSGNIAVALGTGDMLRVEDVVQ